MSMPTVLGRGRPWGRGVTADTEKTVRGIGHFSFRAGYESAILFPPWEDG